MHSHNNLVIIFFTLGYLINGFDSLSLNFSKREIKDSSLMMTEMRANLIGKSKRPASIKIIRPTIESLNTGSNKISSTKGNVDNKSKMEKNAFPIVSKKNKLALIHDLKSGPKIELEYRDKRKKPKRGKRKVLMALLLAYKLKFAALIPIIIGGLALLVSTTALAGFFFALFAAVLGLKQGH